MAGQSWDVEEILELNGPKVRPDRTRPRTSRFLEHIRMGGVLPDVLALAANEIENRPEHYVAAFFQLPFPVKVSETWTRIARPHPDVAAAYFHFQPVKMDFDGLGNPKLEAAEAKDDLKCGIFSQGVMLVPLFGVRAGHHHKFLHHADFGGAGNPTIVSQRDSWVSPGDVARNVPITFDGYEYNFTYKLLRILMTAIPRFLSAYSIASLSAVSTSEKVLGFCAMIAPGRVSFRGAFYPITKGLLDQGVVYRDTLIHNSAEVEKASKLELREFGDFEKQIFALERLSRMGELALSLVGGMSLLEWLLRHHVSLKGEQPKYKIANLINQAAVDLFDEEECEFLHAMRDARNRMTHEELPERHSYSAGSSRAGREIGGMSSSTTLDEIRYFLELIFELFRRHNLGKSSAFGAELKAS